MNEFISEDNKYALDNVDFKHNLTSVWIEDQYVVFNWDGNVRFFTDSNGVGDTYIDSENDIELTLSEDLSEENLIINPINTNHVIEFIVQEEFNLKYKEEL